jgi:MFS superfamily sulfate permease-like transporter
MLRKTKFLMEFLWDILGDIPSGFPPFKLPAFSFQNGDKTYPFTEICRNLGSSLYIAPLVAVLESIAIAKSLGNNNQCEKCSFFKINILNLNQYFSQREKN